MRQIHIAKADAFGVVIRNDIKAVIILANIATAARFSSRGAEIMEAQRKIKVAYNYDHSHDADSIKVIMKLLATADEQRDRTAIKAPKGFANMATNKLRELVDVSDSDSLSTTDESAMAATSDSGSTTERPARRGRASQRKATRRTARRTARTSTSPSPTQSTRGPYVSPTRRSTSRARRS